jgi:hypothetical protein
LAKTVSSLCEQVIDEWPAATLEQETAGGVVHVSEFIIRGDHRQVVELEFAHGAEATASFARRSPEAPHDGI